MAEAATGSAASRCGPGVPDPDDILAALRAGYRSIDDGYGFYAGFDGWLASLGYQRRQDIDCTCPDRGYRGHLPECRWVRP